MRAPGLRRRLGDLSLCLAAASTALAGHAHAGPVGDFERALRSAYADYRTALFQTNSSNQDQAVAAIAAFRRQWSALAASHQPAPPQYADDLDYRATLARVAAKADSAATQAAAGKAAEAHETLEAIRDEIGDLHARNGLVGFSDRMNAYHAWMEHILTKDYAGFAPAGIGSLREDAAVLGYLAAEIASHPPAEASDGSYQPLLDGVLASTGALREAARSGDAQAARKAVGGLKVPYSKFFLKFG